MNEELQPAENAPDDAPDAALSKDKNKETKKRGISPVLKLRLILCAICALCAFILKTAGGELFGRAKELYEEYASRSIVAEPDTSAESFVEAAKNDFQSR